MNTNVISFSSKKKYKTGTSPEDKLSNSSAISQANAQSQLPASYQDKQYLDYQDQRVKYPLNQQPLEKQNYYKPPIIPPPKQIPLNHQNLKNHKTAKDSQFLSQSRLKQTKSSASKNRMNLVQDKINILHNMLKAQGAKVDRMKTTKDKLLASNLSQKSKSDRTQNINEQLSTYKGASNTGQKQSYSRPMSRNDMPLLVSSKEPGWNKKKRFTIPKNSRMQIQSPFHGGKFDRYDGYNNDDDYEDQEDALSGLSTTRPNKINNISMIVPKQHAFNDSANVHYNNQIAKPKYEQKTNTYNKFRKTSVQSDLSIGNRGYSEYQGGNSLLITPKIRAPSGGNLITPGTSPGYMNKKQRVRELYKLLQELGQQVHDPTKKSILQTSRFSNVESVNQECQTQMELYEHKTQQIDATLNSVSPSWKKNTIHYKQKRAKKKKASIGDKLYQIIVGGAVAGAVFGGIYTTVKLIYKN